MSGVKVTGISIEWTNSGAVVKYGSGSIDWDCPRCATPVKPGTEHYCGDRVKVPVKRKVKKP